MTFDADRLTQQQLAAVFGVTPRTVRDWTAAGMPRNADGSYQARACIDWHVARKLGPDGLDLNAERARLAKAQADKTEIENEVRAGRLLEQDRVIREVGDMLAAFRARVIAIPDAVGQLFDPATARKVVPELRARLYEALAELAEYQPGVPAHPGADGGAATDADGESVGGPVPTALKRKQRRARTVAN